jgi:hypothetical protein
MVRDLKEFTVPEHASKNESDDSDSDFEADLEDVPFDGVST